MQSGKILAFYSIWLEWSLFKIDAYHVIINGASDLEPIVGGAYGKGWIKLVGYKQSKSG